MTNKAITTLHKWSVKHLVSNQKRFYYKENVNPVLETVKVVMNAVFI